MPSCAASGCTNRSSDKTLSFHGIPSESRNKFLRKAWIHNMRRSENLPKDAFICSKHFQEECFYKNYKVIHHVFSKKNTVNFVF